MSEEVKDDFVKRCENANDEIKPILENYKLGLSAQFEYLPEGIRPKVVYADLSEDF